MSERTKADEAWKAYTVSITSGESLSTRWEKLRLAVQAEIHEQVDGQLGRFVQQELGVAREDLRAEIREQIDGRLRHIHAEISEQVVVRMAALEGHLCLIGDPDDEGSLICDLWEAVEALERRVGEMESPTVRVDVLEEAVNYLVERWQAHFGEGGTNPAPEREVPFGRADTPVAREMWAQVKRAAEGAPEWVKQADPNPEREVSVKVLRGVAFRDGDNFKADGSEPSWVFVENGTVYNDDEVAATLMIGTENRTAREGMPVVGYVSGSAPLEKGYERLMFGPGLHNAPTALVRLEDAEREIGEAGRRGFEAGFEAARDIYHTDHENPDQRIRELEAERTRWIELNNELSERLQRARGDV